MFYPATAQIEKYTGRLEVSCEKVPAPVAVRYCFGIMSKGHSIAAMVFRWHLFRTDTWEVKE